MSKRPPQHPSWDKLYELAAAQGGYFTRAQALGAGYSDPLLHYHVARKRLERTGRGQFRLVHFPPSEDEDFVAAWLWSERQGVFSHETALRMHQLSDVLPGEKHLTLPVTWQRRRLKIPAGLILHFANLSARDVEWHGAVRVTSALRTLLDCEADAINPELLSQAKRQAVQRGLVQASDLRKASLRQSVQGRR
jgi:predicted transcriptional regulator of viral defense system